MSFNFLGNPTLDEIDDLRNYLSRKYGNINAQVEALQHEIDNLSELLADLSNAEARLASIYGKLSSDYALTDYVRAPVVDEDHTYFNEHRYSNAETAALIDQLVAPWIDHVKRELETLDYKIRKTQYIIERKQQQIQVLQNIDDDTSDVNPI